MYTTCLFPEITPIVQTESQSTTAEHFRQIDGMTFKLCLTKSQRPKFQYLQADDGQKLEWLEAEDVTSPGECLTPNIGECPSVEKESSLSQILIPRGVVHPKYYLTPRACRGILRRAAAHNKNLPLRLKAALEVQATQ